MKAFWVGNKDADNIVIYFPGGGYCIPTSWAHVSQVAALSDDLKHNGQDVGFLILSYDLPPAHRWPAQLAQAVSALQYVIEKLNKRPSNIILQGDSAGAHLALALLSHLAQPHPDSNIPALPLTENIRGALFLCPWIDFDTTYESFTRNAKKDVFTARALERWGQSFLEDTPADPYMQPATNAPPGWWGKLPVNRMFIGAGADEVLVDSIMKFASSVKVCLFNLRLAYEILTPLMSRASTPIQLSVLSTETSIQYPSTILSWAFRQERSLKLWHFG